MEDTFDPIIPGEAGATAESVAEARRLKDAARKRRERAAKRQEKEAINTQSESEWWAGNRARLQPSELEAMVEQDAYVHELLFSMETLQGSDEELVEIVAEHVKENGTAHLGYITKDPDNLPASWASQEYWKAPAVLAALENEGTATAVYVRYGFLTSLIDWRVVEFLHKKAGWDWWKAAELVGYVEHRSGVRHK